MTAVQFNEACVTVGLYTQGQVADFLAVSLRTAHGYANGEPIPAPVAKLLRLMVRLNIAAKEVR